MRLFDSIKGAVRPKTEVAARKQAAVLEDQGREQPQSRATAGPGAGSSTREIDWRVLLIGGDPSWFRQLESEFLRLQPDWLTQHATGLAEAETVLDTSSFDGLIVDGRMEDVGSLLTKLEKKIGRMICLVRCDIADRTTVTQWNRSGMTPVSGDSDAATLVAGLKRLERLRSWMADSAIKKLLPLIRKLPTEPRLHSQITDQLQSPNASIQTVALLISQDPVMSAKILQVVNSAFFGLAQELTDTAEAVMVLGTERIRSLILLAGVFSQYSDAKCPGFSPEPIWGHSLQTAMFARGITFAEMKDARLAETAFTAGLLHDIGKLVLAGNVPEMYDTVRRMQMSKKLPLREAETMVLGTTHAQLGSCLLATWGLPLPILEAIAWHHEPCKSSDKGFSLLAAVHAANVFAQESGQGCGDDARDTIDVEYLMRIGLGDCRNRWRECCGISTKPEPGTAEERVIQRREAKQN